MASRAAAAIAVSNLRVQKPMPLMTEVAPYYLRTTELVVNKLSGKKITAEGLSVLYMSLAMAMHFFGYEFARSTALSIFTSDTIGFTSASSISLAMACVTPFSMFLLMFYSQQLENNGPRVALRKTSGLCTVSLLLLGLIVYAIEKSVTLQLIQFKLPYYNKQTKSVSLSLGKAVVWVLYLLQNSYAHLLCTQHWSFIGSVLTSAQGAPWFASIAGLTSLTSTIAAGIVSRLVNYTSLPLLFALGTASSMLISIVCAEAAYETADTYGFTPQKEEKQKSKENKLQAISNVSSKGYIMPGNATKQKQNMINKAFYLFQRVPALKLLCCEVISFTSLSTLMSVSLLTKMKSSMPDDSMRAAFSSTCWFYTNAVSGCLQFFILPVLFKLAEPRLIWSIMPTIIFAISAYQSLQIDPGIRLLSIAFYLSKVVDYALRGVISEMVRSMQ